MKYRLLAGIIFTFIVSLACSSITISIPTTISSPTSSPLATTYKYTPTPILNLTPERIQLYGYTEMDCSNTQLPEGYTSQSCFTIDNESKSFGVIYYRGATVRAIVVQVKQYAPSNALASASYFIGFAARSVGWSWQDTLKCTDMVSSMQDGDRYTCGHYIIYSSISSDSNYLVIYLVQE